MSRTIHVVGAAIIRGATCLAAQRSAAMSNPLKWEFPGGKIEPGESPEQALVREIHEELGLTIQVGTFLGRGFGQTRSGDTVQLDVYAAQVLSGDLDLAEHADAGWFSPDVLVGLDWDDADRPALRQLLHVLKRPAP